MLPLGLGRGNTLNDPQSTFGFPRLSASHAEKIKTNSAVNPLLWLAALVLPTSILGAYFLPDYRLFFVSTILVVIAAPIIAYFIWMFKEPNRLQSEDYQLAHQKMLLLGDDRHPGIVVRSPSGGMVPNANLPQIEDRS
jgi:hypothetical protein